MSPAPMSLARVLTSREVLMRICLTSAGDGVAPAWVAR